MPEWRRIDMSNEQDIIKIEKVKFAYGERLILDDLSLTIRRGEIIAIMGASGGGKTTLLGLIGGRLAPPQVK